MSKMRVFLSKCTSLLALVLGYAPVWVILSALLCADFALKSLLLPLLLLPLGAGCYLVRGRRRGFYCAAALLAYALLGWLLLPRGGIGPYLLLLPGVLLFTWVPRSASSPVGQEWPVGVWAGGFISGVIILILLSARGLNERGTVMQARAVLPYLVMGYVFLLMINLNRLSVEAGTVGKGESGLSAAMFRRNRMGVVLLFLFGLLCALWKKMALWLDRAVQAVKGFIRWLFSLIRLPGMTGVPPTEDGGMGMDMGAAEEMVEKGAFALFMEKVLMVIGCIGAAVGIAFALYFLGKKLVALLRRIMARMKMYMRRAGEDYVDETESIFDPEEVKKLLQEQVQQLFRPRKKAAAARWQDLDARGKVRWIYREFMRRHPGSEALTAREALEKDMTISRSITQPFARLYDRARYSDHAIDEKDARIYRDLFKY